MHSLERLKDLLARHFDKLGIHFPNRTMTLNFEGIVRFGKPSTERRRKSDMSFRQTARDGATITGAWLLGIALVLIAVLIGVLTWANIAPWATEKQREINHNSQQYQDSQIREARNLLDGIVIAGDKGQKKLLIRRFCSTVETIDELPDDLMAGDNKYC